MKNEMCAEVRHDRAGHNYSLSDGADQHYNSCDIYIGLINYWPLYREECKLESKERQKFASSKICFCAFVQNHLTCGNLFHLHAHFHANLTILHIVGFAWKTCFETEAHPE